MNMYAHVIERPRTPIINWLDLHWTWAANLATCRTCTGFWISAAYLHPTTLTGLLELAAINGAHLATLTYLHPPPPAPPPPPNPNLPAIVATAANDLRRTNAATATAQFLDQIHTQAPNATISDIHQTLDNHP